LSTYSRSDKLWNVCYKSQIESGKTFVSLVIFRSILSKIFLNTLDRIGSRLIGLYDDGYSGVFYLRISMAVEYFYSKGKYDNLSIELNR